jgi:peptidyl-prolyl cis-trans isomerase SurA
VHRAITYTITMILVAFLLAACTNSGGGSGAGGSKDTAVAATVNGKSIMLSEVDRLISQQMQGQQGQLSPLELAQARLQVLTGLVQKEVLMQRAEREKTLPTEDEINSYINNFKTQSGMTEEDFQKRLKEQGMTADGLREEARKTLAVQKLQEKINGKIQAPTDKEVEDYYNNNKRMFVNARGVALADIVVDPLDNSQQGIQNDARGDAEAKQKIDIIYQQLQSGADFATVARERSEDAQSRMRGGDVGFATEDDLKTNNFPKELIDQFFGPMQVGSYTAPVNFNNRWYIFKLQRKQLQEENLTLDSQGVRQQIAEALTSQRKQLVNQALVEVAMNDAKIINNLATNMLTNPSNLSGPRPASTPTTAGGQQPNSNTTATANSSQPMANTTTANTANTATANTASANKGSANKANSNSKAPTKK